MIKNISIIPSTFKIDFVRMRHISFTIVASIIVASFLSIFSKGFNFGIDFKGGYLLEVRFNKDAPDVTALREKLNTLKLGEIMIQQAGSTQDFLIKIENQEGKNSTAEVDVISVVKQSIGENADYRKVEKIGPKVGQELVNNAITAIALALTAMLIYIAVRFEWQFAICAIAALAHDCIAILGFFSIFSLEFNETAIIAILITAGYSINDTIVIFDRIRETMKRFTRMDISEVINTSLNETLSRTFLTAFTTLIAIVSLLIFGGEVISKFSLPIAIGILIGSFSSIFVASPLLKYLNLKIHSQHKNQIPANQA
ncbi:MAG: protein translocase subunit SecF [Candidatus Puniceispirillum sp.]|nr:protein translocase subunit SecF [Candidatus Pelagibacter sp.]MBA4282847.1 protein translocase subunit SecF [Candidatus Puniceispirillum sp.]